MRVAPMILLLVTLAGCAGPTSAPAAHRQQAAAPIERLSVSMIDVPVAEPTIGITRDGSILVQGLKEVMRSTDHGATWTAVQRYPALSLDPWLAVDPVTDRIYSDHNSAGCTSASWSDDHGATWTPYEPVACGMPVDDFQKTAAGIPGPVANPLAGKLYPSVIYMCINKPTFTDPSVAGSYGLSCAASYDGGVHFENEKLLSQTVVVRGTEVVPGCWGGSWGPAVAPDGTVVVRSWPDCMFRSRDSGATWQAIGKGPDFDGTLLAFDRAGTLYALAAPDAGPLRMARSSDQGKTWSAPWSVVPPGVGSISFHAMVAGDRGRVAVAFLGNDTFYNDTHDAPENALWKGYVVTIEDADGSPRMTTFETPTPLHRGCISRNDPCPGLGDFVTMTAAPDGTPYVVFPSPCLKDCTKMAERGAAVPGGLVGLQGWSLKASG